jgi:hypothetical protein
VSPHGRSAATIESLEKQLAEEMRTDVEEIKAALHGISRPRFDWKALRFYLVPIGLAAICLIAASWLSARESAHAAPGASITSLTLETFLEHIGVAFLVAVFVAGVFHWAHEQKLIGRPLGQIRHDLDEVHDKVAALGNTVIDGTRRWDETLSGSLNNLTVTVSGFSNIMSFAKEKGITGAFAPRTPEWEQAIVTLLNRAEDFVYISARTLRPFLIHDTAMRESGWLGRAIERRLRAVPSLNATFMLADVFDDKGSYRDELKMIFANKQENEAERQGCRHAVEWLIDRMVDLRLPDGDSDGSQVSLRLLESSPSIFMIMSENEAIVGHYMPYKPLDCVRMIRIAKESSLYQDFKDYFLTMFSFGVEPMPSLTKYLFRHAADRSVTLHWKAVYEKLKQVPSTNAMVLRELEPHWMQLQHQGVRLTGPSGVDSRATDPAVVRSYARGESRFVEAALQSIDNGGTSVYILGRSHAAMLGETYHESTGAPAVPWLSPALRQLLARRDPKVKIVAVFPDTFSDGRSSEYDEELKIIARNRNGKGRITVADVKHQTRRTVDNLLDLAMEADALPDALRIYLIRQSPRVCMLMTDDECFSEVYMPGEDGGANGIDKIDRATGQVYSPRYQALRAYFESLVQLPDTRDALGVIAAYCNAHSSDFSRDRQVRLERYLHKYGRPS